MRIKTISIDYFKKGRIHQSQKHEDRKTVLFWIRKITAGETIPPLEVSFLTGSRHVSLINGYHRLRALIALNKKTVAVQFTPRKVFNQSLFGNRGFVQKDYTKETKRPNRQPRPRQ